MKIGASIFRKEALMCFSAGASFGAGAVLGVFSIVVHKKRKLPNQRLFAAIPAFFSMQQLAEGFVWLTFMRPDWLHLQSVFAGIFLSFALIIWPVWLPVAVWLIEEDPKRKKWLALFSGAGLLFSCLAGFFLFSHSVFPEIKSHHIHYALGFSGSLIKGATSLYFLPTLIPPFLSSFKNVRLMGVFLLVSYLVSKFYFADAVVSVWCFLAAFISFLVLLALKEMAGKTGIIPVQERPAS